LIVLDSRLRFLTMANNTVWLGTVPVGEGYPTVFVAETGTFFNQDVGNALEYVKKVANSGVRVFKTEILHDADICLDGTGLAHTYRHAHGQKTEDYRSLIERKVLPLAEYEKLFSAASDLDLEVMASAYDTQGVDFIRINGGSSVKIARNNINNIPLIRYAGRSGLPVIFDMGHVYLDEISFAVRCAMDAGAEQIIVNLHPGSNPAPAEAHHLHTVDTIKSMFDIPVGLSCHYRGDEILYAAVGVGIHLLEKGVDADPDRVEQDLVSALPLDRLSDVVDKVYACWQALGTCQPHVPEDRDLTTRAGIYIKHDIVTGDVLNSNNMGWAFPPHGIPVSEWDRVVNRKAKSSIKAGTPLTWDAVDFAIDKE